MDNVIGFYKKSMAFFVLFAHSALADNPAKVDVKTEVTNTIATDTTLQTPFVSPSTTIIEMLVGLAVVVLMILALVWLTKRLGLAQHQTGDLMKIKSCLPLSTKEKLLLVEVGNEQVIVGVSPGGISHIKTLDSPVSNNHKTSNNVSFADKLKIILNKSEPIG